MGERAIEGGGFQVGQLAVSKGLARMGICCHEQRATNLSEGSFSFSCIINLCMLWILYHVNHVMCVFDIKEDISSVQVKNIPCDEKRNMRLFFAQWSTW